MVGGIVCVAFLMSFLHDCHGKRWNMDLTHPESLNDNAVLEDLVKLHVIQIGEWGCLDEVQAIGHSRNNWHEIGKATMTNMGVAKGTTMWVHEWMQIGHAQYDVEVIQVLATTPVDRIVLQRAPCEACKEKDCGTSDLCYGVGTWKSWFQGFYAIMIDAFRPGIPVFIRFYNSSVLDAHHLSIVRDVQGVFSVQQIIGEEKFALNEPEKCFERLIKKDYSCEECVATNAVSPKAAEKFKEHAYKLASSGVAFPLYFNKSKPIIITHAYRSKSSRRHMANIEYFQEMLTKAFPAPQFEYRAIQTPDVQDGEAGIKTQIPIYADSQVVITEHGATQVNLIFCRKGALAIDLLPLAFGNKQKGPHRDYEGLARNFGVFFEHVVLDSHPDLGTRSFQITEKETNNVISLIKDYVNERPFEFNTV